jgi:hypothetical protein
MLALMQRASDRLASKVVGSVDAGACLPHVRCYCQGGHWYYQNCVGQCVWTGYTC